MLDIFQSQMWSDFAASTPNHFQLVAEGVRKTVLHSKADGTVRTYLGGFNRWKRWAVSNGLCPLPANPFHVATSMQCLVEEARSASPIWCAVFSIDWVHKLCGFWKISAHPLVDSMLKACQRLASHPKKRKEPITVAMLEALTCKLKDKYSVYERRTVALCLIGLAVFFRFSELSSIRCCDVKWYDSYVCIFVESSKTDQFREGAWISIARSDGATCPVGALEEYVRVAGLDLGEELPLFRALGSRSCARKVRGQGISYSRVRELIQEAFKDITDVSKIGVLSLRSGGATAAANAGIPDGLFKRHGRWLSESAKDGYVKDSTSSLLSVSRSLGV